MSTNSGAKAIELGVIEQWLEKTTNISKTTMIELHLPQSKYILKILDISY